MLLARDALTKALNRVKPALGKGGKILALSHFWFDGDYVYASDGGFGIELKYETDLNCGVPGATLLGLLATTALSEVGVEAAGKTGVKIKLGKSEAKVTTLDFEDRVWAYPDKLPKGAKSTELNSAFSEALRKMLLVRAGTPTRVEHYGVLVQKRKNDLELYATDSGALAVVTLKGVGKAADFEKVLLPREFAEQLLTQSPDGVKLTVLADCIVAAAADATFYSNLLDVSQADDMGAIVERHLAKHPEPAEIPAGLDGALARAEVLAGQQDPVVTLEADGKKLTVVGDYALGGVNDTLELERALPKAKIRVLASHIRRALPHSETLSLTQDSLIMAGEPAFTYLVGMYIGDNKK